MKVLKYILLFYFLISGSAIKSNELKTLALINNNTITTYDLFVEIKTLELLNNRKILNSERMGILNNLINQKIKKLEIEKNNNLVNQDQINKQLSQILKQRFPDQMISKEIKEKIKEKIIVAAGWNEILKQRYAGKLDINMNEISERLDIEKLNIEEKNKIILKEKNKKLNSYSTTLFNEVKRSYYVQILKWNLLEYY